jgi:hypothetical protein
MGGRRRQRTGGCFPAGCSVAPASSRGRTLPHVQVFFAAGMGGGGGSSSGSGGKTGGTPAGSYTITVTAISASPQLSHTAIVAVTVQ